MTQADLWHDSAEDAIKAVLIGVYGKGWQKKAAAEMWPLEDPVDKGKWLERCLLKDTAEKLSLTELIWILRKGRDAGIHTAFAFLADECDYEFKAVAPQDELATLQREYIRAVEQMKRLTEQMARVQVRVAS